MTETMFIVVYIAPKGILTMLSFKVLQAGGLRNSGRLIEFYYLGGHIRGRPFSETPQVSTRAPGCCYFFRGYCGCGTQKGTIISPVMDPKSLKP